MPDDETTNVTPTPATPPAAVAPQPAVSFASQEEFDARLRDERNAAAAAARRETEARLKPKAEPPKVEASKPDATATPGGMTVEEFKRARAFDRAIGQHGLSDEQTADLEQLLEVQRPENVSEWVAQKARLFGKSNAPNPNTPPTPAQQTGSGSPQPSATPTPAPSTSIPNEAPDDVMRWSEAQWEAYVRRNGAMPGNPYHWSNHKVHQELARKAEASMATKRIVINTKR